jgi:drug/metabolite transporter (DMT)-like permease
MTKTAAPPSFNPARWLNQQPYLLLSLASLFWASNIVLGRYVAGHVPPMTLSCIRWIGACLSLLPFAWPHLARDWPALRERLPLMLVLSATGFALNNALSYWALQFTQAINALLIQSAGPLFIALWVLILFGVKLTWAQLTGIALSLLGVLTIILRGDPSALAAIRLNLGDLMTTGAVISFGLYSALMLRRPVVHQLSLICFTMACGALLLLPPSIWEYANGIRLKFDTITMLTLALFGCLSVLQPRHCSDWTEPRRTVFPSDAGVRLGDGDPVARRRTAAFPSCWLPHGARRHRDRLAKGFDGLVSRFRKSSHVAEPRFELLVN